MCHTSIVQFSEKASASLTKAAESAHNMCENSCLQTKGAVGDKLDAQGLAWSRMFIEEESELEESELDVRFPAPLVLLSRLQCVSMMISLSRHCARSRWSFETGV